MNKNFRKLKTSLWKSFGGMCKTKKYNNAICREEENMKIVIIFTKLKYRTLSAISQNIDYKTNNIIKGIAIL